MHCIWPVHITGSTPIQAPKCSQKFVPFRCPIQREQMMNRCASPGVFPPWLRSVKVGLVVTWAEVLNTTHSMIYARKQTNPSVIPTSGSTRNANIPQKRTSKRITVGRLQFGTVDLTVELSECAKYRIQLYTLCKKTCAVS